MRCPTCGRFISEEHPCSNCWADMGECHLDITDVSGESYFYGFEDYDPVWRRILRGLKRVLYIGGN